MQAASRAEKGKFSFTRHPEVLTLGVAVAVSFILRFALLPWDGGGTFFHVYIMISNCQCGSDGGEYT